MNFIDPISIKFCHYFSMKMMMINLFQIKSILIRFGSDWIDLPKVLEVTKLFYKWKICQGFFFFTSNIFFNFRFIQLLFFFHIFHNQFCWPVVWLNNERKEFNLNFNLDNNNYYYPGCDWNEMQKKNLN